MSAPRNDLGRFVVKDELTEPIFERLCETHRDGRDFRNVTALRCGVHPKMLSRWLQRGEREEGTIHARLFLAFGQIEGDLRAKWIAEVEDTDAGREETSYDEDGKVTSKVVTRRRTHGVQWLLERRFRQFRADWAVKEDESEIAQMLAEQQREALSLDAAIHLVRQIAQNMPAQLRPLFEAEGWRQLPKESPHARPPA